MIEMLYVDDEGYSLDLVKTFLEETGDFTVDTATSVREAKDMMASKSYDALVSDYSMPEIDGLEFLHMVRERDGGIPFILFSGRSREEVVIEAYNGGASCYVQKGYDLEVQFAELAHKVRQAVARHVAEEHLRVRQLQARMAIDLAKIASWEFDVRTNLYVFDDIFYELLGTTAECEGGYTMDAETYLREFVHPEDVERVLEFMMTGTRWQCDYLQIEHRMMRRDGEVRDVIVRVGLLKDACGNVLKVVGINQDVTGR
ncbi:MAG: response regulator [Methanomassiliicoccus sp.]|nr:response regulator [Methanomassiliicoccus sp.]